MSAPTETVGFLTHSMDDLREILEHARRLGLPPEEYEALALLLDSHAFLVTKIGEKTASIERLRQLVFGTKTETKKNVLQQAGREKPAPPERKAEEKPKGHGRTAASDYVGAERVRVPHETLKAGHSCPECTGKVYAQKPRLFLRIRGGAPFTGTVYEQDCVRCHLCGKVFPATMPPGVGTEKYDETVSGMLALLRYGSGLPMNRMAGLQKVMGVPLPVSVQWDLLKQAAKKLEAVYREHVRQAAQGQLFYNDDTPMRILAFLAEKKRRQEQGEEPPERSGTFTSGIVSELTGDLKIVLYFTGQRHAGENLAEVLAQRASSLAPPLQMCDGLDRNLPGELETILGNCLVHARRYFVDVVQSFPAEVEHLLTELALVYRNDARAKAEKMSAEERLRLHRTESGPVMVRVKAWMDALLAEKKVEPNSGLGGAIRYATKRWERLTRFLERPGAPLDNSLCERVLKKAILHRKNSMFYKTQNGADVGDLYMSLIATAKLAKADPFDYLTQLQHHEKDVTANPADWMPWNYRETLTRGPPAD